MEDFGSVLDKNAAEFTVMDVYDIAAVVGQEFERIIDQYGCEALTRLMPKVVRVLEVLEVLVSRSNINPETEGLRRELDRLRMERNDRLEKEKKHQQELELVEDVWRGEAQDLLTQIAQLQAENRNLLMSLSLKDSPITVEELQKQEGMSERERQVMKDVVDKQRDEIRAKDRELTLKNEDLEALQMQQHRLMKINQDLRHRISVMEAQGKAVIQQRAELEALSQARQQDLVALRQEVARLREEHQEWELERERVEEEKEEPSPSKSVMTEPTLAPTMKELCDEEQEEETDSLDQKDSERPRFTLQELRDVLQERNELKAEVFMLQEELAYYKSEELENELSLIPFFPSPQPEAAPAEQPESGIKRLFSIFSRDKRQLEEVANI